MNLPIAVAAVLVLCSYGDAQKFSLSTDVDQTLVQNTPIIWNKVEHLSGFVVKGGKRFIRPLSNTSRFYFLHTHFTCTRLMTMVMKENNVNIAFGRCMRQGTGVISIVRRLSADSIISVRLFGPAGANKAVRSRVTRFVGFVLA